MVTGGIIVPSWPAHTEQDKPLKERPKRGTRHPEE